MHEIKAFTAALVATTLGVGGLAYAADHAHAADHGNTGVSGQGQVAIDADAQKMSREAQVAFADVGHARLSIFDGDIETAKTLVKDASAAFARAKTDRSVFMKAEADLQSPDRSTKDAAKTPTAWLPVDGAVVMNEDFTATDAAKKAAVADANQKLAKGDRKGAMEKLKLAHVDVDFVMAAVPVEQTVADVDQAGMLLQGGKYYETSQVLRKIEDSVRYTSLDVSGAPHAHPATGGEATTTH